MLALSACEASLPQPLAADAARLGGSLAGTSVHELELGRTLYSSRCGSCHALRDPASEMPEAWRAEVHEMRSKKGVRISDDEERRITAYLVSISSR
jgi:cytochrome c5